MTTDTFAPPADFTARALVTDNSLHAAAAADGHAFWMGLADELTWMTPPTTSQSGEMPRATWFADGTLNASVNCLDRHVDAGNGDRVAFHFEGEPGDREEITYAQLLERVCKAANALTELGVTKGDRVAIYLPMIPELAVSMLACARIGAAHSVIFAGFSAASVRDRINDAECKVVISADGGNRRGSVNPLKPTVDEALTDCPSITHQLVVKRGGNDVTMQDGRDVWWHDAVADQPATCDPAAMNAEDLLFLLYTSGTTGKPKGIMHSTGGYLAWASFTHKHVFDINAQDDLWWCAADCGWITGHSYIVYGPLANGVSSVMYEGVPNHPAEDRFWDIVERYEVTSFYTAPTAIRAFMKWGEDLPAKHDLSSLRVLGSVGEPINPEAWRWYHRVIGGESAPIVDTWWQTETGGIMISPLPGLTPTKPGSATFPLPGISAELVTEEGEPVDGAGEGLLTITAPWPGMLRGIWGDDERFIETYFSRFEGRYLTGDGARVDEDGYIWVLGRIDDVMNVSGHRLSTAEIESALVSHADVAEAAVIGRSDELTGQAVVAFVTTIGDAMPAEADLVAHVAKEISPIAKPKRVVAVPDLPKTRSGKIMRRLLRDIAEGRELGNTTTLADPSVVDAIQEAFNA